MKIKNLAIIILMTTFFIILGTKAYASTGKIIEETVKLRKEPDSKIIIDYVYKDDEVEILELEEGWYKVKAETELGKVTGYISESEVDTEGKKVEDSIQEQETMPVVEEELTETIPDATIDNIVENNEYLLQQEIGVKAIPLINSREKAKMTGNIKVIEIINDWARIENDTESGWTRKNTLKISLTQIANTNPEQEQVEEQPKETEPEEKQEPTETKLNKVGYVTTEGLIVRKGPSTDSKELDGLSKNDKVQIIGREGNWYKIEWKDGNAYVSAKYISDTKLSETSRSGSTLKNEDTLKTEEIKTEQPEEVKKEETKPETSETTSNTTGAAVVEYAKKYLGYKYVSGGASPSTGFDCSGFTSYVYKNFGVSLNRVSGAQINNGVAVEKSDLQPGDIVLFNNEANTKIGHVGIYIGDGNFIHASNPKDGVKITTLLTGYYKIRYVGARRVI